MTFHPGRYAKWLCILFFAIVMTVIAVTVAIVSLPSPITAKPSTLASGEAAVSVIVEAEQATLAGPVTVGKSSSGVRLRAVRQHCSS